MYFQVGSQLVWADVEATKELYRTFILNGDADLCSCIYCKNFAPQREVAYSLAMLELVAKLGVEFTKEWETYYLGPEKRYSERHLYSGWFLIIGEILEEGDMQKNFDCEYSFTLNFPSTTLPPTLKFCAVQFNIAIPWILNELPESYE